jgi:predicted permease
MEQSQAIRYQLLLSLLITLLISYWGYIRLIASRTSDDSVSDDVDLKAQAEEELFNEEF